MTSYYKKYEEYLPEFNRAVDNVLSILFWSYERFMKKGVTYEVNRETVGKKTVVGLVESKKEILLYSVIGDWLNEYNIENENGSKFIEDLTEITSKYLERAWTITEWTPEKHKELELAKKEIVDHISNLDIDVLERRKIKSKTE